MIGGPYLTPGAGEPLGAALTGAVVAGLSLGRPLGPAALQRQTADVIAETQNAARPHTHAAVRRALPSQHKHVSAATHA